MDLSKDTRKTTRGGKKTISVWVYEFTRKEIDISDALDLVHQVVHWEKKTNALNANKIKNKKGIYGGHTY